MNPLVNMAMPDFLIIGTMKGGTTSLYHYLLAHPQIAAATRKEIHFFDNNFHRGIAWYRAQFPALIQCDMAETRQSQRVLTGESSPYYLFHPLAPARAALVVPKAKLIVLLRNPVDRAYSHYNQQVRKGRETLSFEDALAQEETRTRDEGQRLATDPHYYSLNYPRYSYLARGIYVDQLQRWMNYFPQEQFFIIKSEDFYATPERKLKEIFLFLGLPDGVYVQREYKQLNSSTSFQAKMEPETRKRLLTYFGPHNERLSTLLGRDFGWDR
jgi:Sulfotransferase domain